MSDLLLSADELAALTGQRQPARMIRWLDQRAWVYEPPARRGDIPKVDRSYYLAKMSGQAPSAQRRNGPALDFMLQPRY